MTRFIRVARWTLYGVASILFLSSFPAAGLVLNLANQEYFHLWGPRIVTYDHEINGKPMTSDQVIMFVASGVLFQWSLAAALTLAPCFFLRERPHANPANDDG